MPETPTRIACCITELDPGGAERAFVRLVTGLDRSQWEPHVFCLSGRGELAGPLQKAGIPVTFLEASGKFDVRIIQRLTDEFRTFRPQIVQSFLHHANMAARFAARRAGVPRVVCGIRVAEQRGRWRLWMDRWTQRLVDAYVCVSPSVAEFSRTTGGLNPDRLHVIPNGVEVETFAKAAPVDWTQLGLPADADVILAVGRLDEQKRPQLAFEACAPLLEEHPGLHLVFAGIGPLTEEIQAAAAARQLSERVHLLGRRDDVPGLMAGARILLLTSAWEGSPNVVLEAHAAALPVVASDIAGNRDATDGGALALLVDGAAPAAFEAALRRVLDDPQPFRAVARKAQIHVQETLTWDSMVAAYARLYVELLQGSPDKTSPE